MTRSSPRRVAIIMLALCGLVAPSAGAGSATLRVAERSTAELCDHPYPCGYRWSGPRGPYEIRPTERVLVESFDGVELNGFIMRPKVPPGVRVPVILKATPYFQAGFVPSTFYVGGILGKRFASAGYALAEFSVRGTGDSGGCFGQKSKSEQKDLAVLVDWLAHRPWSNGRVGMQGLSYTGTTPVMAAIQNPPALKTIVIAGTILDEYGFIHTPQGASFVPLAMAAFGPAPGITLEYSLFPGSPNSIGTTAERLCEEMAESNTTLPIGEISGDRNAEYWSERRFIDGVPGITAATFVVHGFQDRHGSGHAFQDDWAWQTLISAPRRMLVGQWWHEWPHLNTVFPDYALRGWRPRLFAWFDYWLKGIGDGPPGLGEVEFQDSSGAWHRTDAWPPPTLGNVGPDRVEDRARAAGLARRRDEVLFLREEKIEPRAGQEAASFLSVVPPWTGGTDPDLTGIGSVAGNGWRWTTPCPDPTRLVYVSDPVEERTLLAGNPFAWLEVESSAPGGSFELQLYDLGPDFSCDDQPQLGDDLRPLTEGAVDLRYHESEDYQAHPFPPLTPTHVRVDLANLAEVLEPGHRLAVVISHGFWRGTTPELAPLITLHGDGGPRSSHLVMPVVRGGFGGRAPRLDYPPRPFLPECCDGSEI